MRRTFLFSTTLLAGTLVLGCSDQPTPAEPGSTPQPSFRAGQNSEGQGAQITRFGVQGIVLSDPDRGFTLTIGVSPSEAPECGGTGEITGGEGQEVVTPADVSHVVVRVRQQPMTLYGRFFENVCELPEAEADIIARGRGNATVVILARTPSTLFGFHATGKVELTSGRLAHLLVVAKFHIDADGTLRVHVDKFKLQPIGG
jgi:hypothetical protein